MNTRTTYRARRRMAFAGVALTLCSLLGCQGPAHTTDPQAQTVTARIEARVRAARQDIRDTAGGTDARITQRFDALLAELKRMQDHYTRRAMLDEAVEVRDTIRALRDTLESNPRRLHEWAAQLKPDDELKTMGLDTVQHLDQALSIEPPPKALKRQPLEARRLEPIDLPHSQPVAIKAVEAAKAVGGVHIASLDLRVNSHLHELVWSPSGRAFYALSVNGLLQKVQHDGPRHFEVVRRIDLARHTSCLSLSAEGLVATMDDLQEVWLLDPMTLAVTKRIPVPWARRAVSSPNVSFALVGGRGGVTYLDLKHGRALHRIPAATAHAQLSPDGKHYFAEGGTEQLVGYPVSGVDLLEPQKSARIASNGQSISVSPDSKLVALPAGGGNGHGYSTYVYKVGDLSRRILEVRSGAYPQCIAFDAKNGLIYAQNHDNSLMVFSDTAIEKHQFSFRVGRIKGGSPRQFALHPEGRKVLLHFGQAVLFVDLTDLKDT